SERDVDRIIRARPGDYGCFPNSGEWLSQEWGTAERWVFWADGFGILKVGYDDEGKVCGKKLEYRPNNTPARPDLGPWWRRLVKRSMPNPILCRWYSYF